MLRAVPHGVRAANRVTFDRIRVSGRNCASCTMIRLRPTAGLTHKAQAQNRMTAAACRASGPRQSCPEHRSRRHKRKKPVVDVVSRNLYKIRSC